MENDGDFADDLKALEKVSWTEILSRQSLRAGLQNLFKTKNNEKPFTHVKLHIFPDGGVARFRVFGDVVLDWSNRNSQELFDMASVLNGGQVLHCNDMFFGPKDNLIVPGRGINMGDGWETRRRRMPGNDYVFLKLGHSTVIEKIDIDTAHFKGNYPHAFMLEGCRVPQDIHYKNLPSEAWKPLMTQTLLQPDHLLTITSGLSSAVVDHVKLNIYPCGGVSRLRLWGKKHR
jgi:allantoicase